MGAAIQSAPPRVTLRAATPADLAFLDAVFASTRSAMLAALGWPPEATQAFLAMQADLQRRSYRLQSPSAEELVVLLDGEPAGRLFIDRSGDGVSVLDVALLPEHRGRGAGTTLLRELQAEAARDGRAVRLQVEHDNPDARRLYERLGFVEVGRDPMRAVMAWSAGVRP